MDDQWSSSWVTVTARKVKKIYVRIACENFCGEAFPASGKTKLQSRNHQLTLEDLDIKLRKKEY